MQTIGFRELYEITLKKINPRKISPFIEAGGVSAAILTESGIPGVIQFGRIPMFMGF
jgi:hypothetical protein